MGVQIAPAALVVHAMLDKFKEKISGNSRREQLCEEQGHSDLTRTESETVKDAGHYKVIKYYIHCKRCDEIINERREVIFAHEEQEEVEDDDATVKNTSWDGTYLLGGPNGGQMTTAIHKTTTHNPNNNKYNKLFNGNNPFRKGT